MSQRLGRRPLPTALLALTGHATLGAVLALQQRGLVVPRDVSLIGFDDNEWMKIMHPAISAVRQPVEALARSAWDQLASRLRGERMPRARVRLACSLELRESAVAPARRRRARLLIRSSAG